MADTLFKPEWTEIVFEGKNQSYGAFDLRAVYSKYMTRALVIGCLLFSAAIATPLIMSFIDFGKNKVEEKVEINLELLPPPPVDPNTPPPPPPPKIEAPKLAAAVKFLPPKVEEDEKVKDEEPPTVDDMKDKQISTENREGEKVESEPIEETPSGPAVVEEQEQVFLVVEEMPEFPGGMAAMQKKIAEGIRYPREASQMGITGRIIVSFVINKDGEVDNVEVVKGIGYGCDEEAIRVVKTLPKWKPGKQNGRSVSVKFTIPIKFALQ